MPGATSKISQSVTNKQISFTVKTHLPLNGGNATVHLNRDISSIPPEYQTGWIDWCQVEHRSYSGSGARSLVVSMDGLVKQTVNLSSGNEDVWIKVKYT